MLPLLGGTLLHLLWQGTLVGVATAIALRLAGPAASRLRYRLALGALALIAVAPLATVARRAGMLADWGLATPSRAAPVSESPYDVTPSQPITANEAPARTTSPLTPVRKANTLEPNSARPSSWRRGHALAWLGALWLVGVASLLARLAGGIVQVYQIRARARPGPATLGGAARHLEQLMGGLRGVPVLLSDRADLPFATGVRHPAVLLPTGLTVHLSPEQIRVVLAHELAHVRRHDYIVNLGQRLLEALFWFHPAVHWLSSVARDEREHCCDELAAEVVGDRRAVAGALLALEEARGPRGSHSLLPAAGDGSLLRRVERLLALVPARRHRWAVGAAGVLLTGGGTMVLATPATSVLRETSGTPATPATPGTRADPMAAGALRDSTSSIAGVPASATSMAPEAAAPVVWAGELRAGERLRVRNIVGSIRVARATGSTGAVRVHLAGERPSDLSFQITREDDGVTVCALRAGYGRCNAEGYTWFGAIDEMRRARIELTVELPPGVSVTAATFQGDLEFEGVDSDAEARTGTGAITARIVDPPDSRSNRTLDLHTGSGTVRVALPPAFGGELEARLSSGRVEPEPLLGPPAVFSHRGLRAWLGPGGNRLRVSSGRGDLVLTRS